MHHPLPLFTPLNKQAHCLRLHSCIYPFLLPMPPSIWFYTLIFLGESRTKSLMHDFSAGETVSDSSESEQQIPMSGSSSYRKAARTYKAIAARNSKYKDSSAVKPGGSAAKAGGSGTGAVGATVITPGSSVGGKSSVLSAFQSYTISRCVIFLVNIGLGNWSVYCISYKLLLFMICDKCMS